MLDTVIHFYIFRNMPISGRELTSALFAALGSEYRLRILELLGDEERCVCEVAPHLPTAFSVVSHHLSVLEQAGLIESRRDGRWMRYRVTDPAVLQLVESARRLARRAKSGRRTARRPKASDRSCCAPKA
ncbi:helix-turn-helix transcriptional regulator [candidate division WOR-3 bacterium]|nr:helix-turn-helix transcriptional regulator [candidate division WOR-3 bacterium]